MRSIPKSSVWRARHLVGLVWLSGLLAGCPEAPRQPRYIGAGQQTPQRGGTFIFSSESDLRTLDPHISYDVTSNIGIKLLFDGLFDYDPNAQLVPRLAKRLPEVSDDGRRFRIELREGVRFHNGRELTAEDVRWSLEQMLHPKTGSPGYTFYTLIEGLEDYRAGKAPHIAGIEVLGRYALEIRLTAPDQTFLYALAMPFAYPVPKEHHIDPTAAARRPVGTGPFLLEEWEPAVRLVFRRNPDYWRPGEPYVDRMVFELNLSRDTAFMRFRNAEIDVAHSFTPADRIFLKQAPAWAPYRSERPSVDVFGVQMNCELAPFDNVHVRRAVAHAIDRERWSRARNYALLPTGQPIPPMLMGHDPDLPTRQQFDLDKAKEEMRLAGYPEGLPDPVTLWIGEGPTGQFYGELIQADLRKIGIRVRIRQVSFPVYLEKTGTPKTVQMFFGGWLQDFPDPANFLDILFHSQAIHDSNASNRTFYRNDELDRLLDRARVEADPERRRQLYLRAQGIVTRDAPWAFTHHNLDLEAWQPYVRGYQPNPVFAQMYRDVWLDLPRQRVARRNAGIDPLQRLASLLPQLPRGRH